MKKIKEWKSEKDIKESREIDKAQRQKIINAINNAKITRRWSYTPGADYSQNQWNQTLAQKIFEVNKEFGGHALICSSEISSILMDSYMFVPDSGVMTYSSFNLLGMFGEFFLFVDMYLPARILIIIKSDFFISNNLECAVIYVDGLK